VLENPVLYTNRKCNVSIEDGYIFGAGCELFGIGQPKAGDNVRTQLRCIASDILHETDGSSLVAYDEDVTRSGHDA